MEKPILLNIALKKGSAIDGARVQTEAPKIAGFLAIESQTVKYATTYIALDNIASFSVLDEEARNIVHSFPSATVRAKIDNSL